MGGVENCNEERGFRKIEKTSEIRKI